jgi:hypothetical protein
MYEFRCEQRASLLDGICLLPLNGCINLETKGSEKREEAGKEERIESWHKHAAAWNFWIQKAKKEQ